MATITKSIWERQEELKNEPLVDFHQSSSDLGHIKANRLRMNGSRETIGHIYKEIYEDETYYVSTNRKGRELFVRTTDFISLERKFERYARLLALQEFAKENSKQSLITNNHSLIKNQNLMTTPTNQSNQKQKKFNLLIYTEFEKPGTDGLLITIRDSYDNPIGRIHRVYNELTKKYDHFAYDHAGILMGQSEKLWELKKEFTNNRTQLLEDAHQRRIASKQKSKESPIENVNEKRETVQPSKVMENQKETAPDKTKTKSNTKSKEGKKTVEKAPEKEKSSRQQEREQELSDLRGEKENDRGDIDMEQ